MNIDPTHRAAELEKDLRVLDEQNAGYLQTRQRYILAIEALRGRPYADRPADPKLKDTPPINGLESYVADISSAKSRRQIVDNAISAMPGKFTARDLKKYLKQNHPDLALKASYLATRLSVLATSKKPKIKLLAKGENGEPNLWIKP